MTTGAASDRANWYALRVRSNFEFKIRDAFRARGIAEFLPDYVETVRWTDRTKITSRPLFPGYIFARFDRFAGAAGILGTGGVIQILGKDERSSISDDEIANLRRIVESPAPVSLCAYVAGERVTVGRGPFTGVTGIVIRASGATRLVVWIDILNARGVEIEAADLEKKK